MPLLFAWLSLINFLLMKNVSSSCQNNCCAAEQVLVPILQKRMVPFQSMYDDADELAKILYTILNKTRKRG
jgi:hypothetical protein